MGKEKKMCHVSEMFRFLSNKNDPGIQKKKKIPNYGFKIGIELP